MLKNTASQHIAFNAVSATDGSAITTGTPVVHITIDAGTQGTSTNTAVHEGNGQWSLALTQAETNGDHITYTMVVTGAINAMVQAYPITLADFMADVSALATSAEVSALNNFDPASDQVIVATNNDKFNYSITGSDMNSIADTVWNEQLSGHQTAGSAGKALTQLKDGIISQDGEVSLGSTTTVIQTNLSNSTNDFYNDLTIAFTGGTLEGQSRVISDYDGASGAVTVDEPLTSTPTSGDDFIILTAHVHTVGSIVDGVWDEPQSSHTTVGTFGYYLDDQVSAAGGGGTAPTEAEIYTYFTSASREDAFKADVSALALETTVNSVGTTVTDTNVRVQSLPQDTYTFFTSGSNEDAFKADVSALATSANLQSVATITLATNTAVNALNDFDPTTDVVARVTLVDTTTTNTDMVDVSGLATSVEIAALNDFDPTTDVVARVTLVDTTTVNTDMVDVSGLATSVEIAALNDFDPATDQVIVATNNDKSGYSITNSDIDSIIDGVWDETASNHTTSGSFGRLVQDISLDIAALDVILTTIVVVNQVALASDVTDIKATTDKLDTLTQSNGVGGFQFTANSLELAPTGSGGGGDSAATIYAYFTNGVRADAFKADVTDLADVKVTTDKLDTALVLDGSVWQYTTNALENAPSGGGGGTADWTVVEREQIRYRLGIDGNIDVPAINNPDLARNTTAQTVIDALTIEIDGLNDFNPDTDTVARVTLVDTTTVNTDMVDISGLATSAEIAALNDVSAEDVYLYFTSGINADSFKADVSGLASQASIDSLNDFNPDTDTVARVTLVDTTTVNTDMVDISGLALEASVQGLNDISASDVYTLFTTGSNADQFKADVTLLSTSAEIAALNDFNPNTDTVARVTLVDTTTVNTDMVDVSGLATQASVDALNNITVDQVVDGVWDEQQSLHTAAGSFGSYLDGQVTSAGGDDAATIYNFFTAGSNEDAFKANVSGLATQISVDALPTAGDIYTQFVAGTNADAFKADVSGLATSTQITSLNDLSSSDVESAVWDAVQTNHTTAGTFGFYLDSTVSTAGGGSMTPSDIYDYFTDLSREDAFKADVAGLAQEASVTALPSAAETYTYFTTGNRPDPFHADITGLATAAQITALNNFDPTTDIVSRVAQVDTTLVNSDMVDISGLATTARIDQLNDFDPATDVVMNVDTVQNVVNIGQGLTGPSVLTITVSDGSNPIENAQVVVKRTGESGFKVSDSNGQVQFAVSDATYDIVVIASGYEGEVDSVVVSGTTGKAITLSATVLPTPSQPELCVVACYIQLNGQPVENATVRATLVNSNSAIDGIVLSNSKDIAETNIDGYAQLELIRLDQFVDGDGQYLIEVFDGNNKLWSTTSTIPNTGAVNLEDLV